MQTITLDLNDPKAAIRAQGKVTLDAKQTAFEGVKLSVGKGRDRSERRAEEGRQFEL